MICHETFVGVAEAVTHKSAPATQDASAIAPPVIPACERISKNGPILDFCVEIRPGAGSTKGSRFLSPRGSDFSAESGCRFLYAARATTAIRRRAKDKILRNFWGFLLLSLGLISPCSSETFRNPRHIPIPSNPLQVGTADFNGDGRPDFCGRARQ